MLIGIISDTHGLIRPEALAALSKCDHLLHAGDIGGAAVLDALREIAPLTAIRGNADIAGECADLPDTDMIRLGGALFYLVHSLEWLDLDPVAAEVAVVVSGHSHKDSIENRKGVVYLNPGSAGPRRFHLPVSVGLVTLDEKGLRAQIVELKV
ncbi:MAG: metallophosphatase family protein [Acidobacteriaceae bacterium]|nr:metallophosphatase family protein [Acidobacteriaceae bacterium]